MPKPQYNLPKNHKEKVAIFLGYQVNGHWWHHSDLSKKSLNADIFDFDSSWSSFMDLYREYKNKLSEIHKIVPKNSAVRGDMLEVDIQCGLMEIDLKLSYGALVAGIVWYLDDWLQTETHKKYIHEQKGNRP